MVLEEELKIQFWEICFRTYDGRNIDTNIFVFWNIIVKRMTSETSLVSFNFEGLLKNVVFQKNSKKENISV